MGEYDPNRWKLEKPCPFCGCTDAWVTVFPQFHTNTYGAFCPNCMVKFSSVYKTEEEVRAAWNRRANE